MKKIAPLLFGLLVFTLTKGQNPVPNPGFELWDSITQPTAWNYSIGITRSTQSNTGMYAAKGTIDTANGSAILWVSGVNSYGIQVSQDYPCFNFSYQFNPVGGDQLDVEVHPMYGDFNSWTGASTVITNGNTQYLEVSLPISYPNPAEYCWFYFKILGSEGNNGIIATHAGSYFIIDDVSLGACSASGINEPVQTTGISIASNPVSNSINLHLTASPQANTLMQLYDICGRVVKTQQITSPDAQINVTDLATGIYTLTMRQADAVVTRKIEIIR
jgi:hypothetical protein